MTRHTTWHRLVGLTVRDSEGVRVGRVVDLVAEPRDGVLRVVVLRVGLSAFLARIGQRRWAPRLSATRDVPWPAVASTDGEIRLRVRRDHPSLNGREHGS